MDESSFTDLRAWKLSKWVFLCRNWPQRTRTWFERWSPSNQIHTDFLLQIAFFRLWSSEIKDCWRMRAILTYLLWFLRAAPKNQILLLCPPRGTCSLGHTALEDSMVKRKVLDVFVCGGTSHCLVTLIQLRSTSLISRNKDERFN